LMEVDPSDLKTAAKTLIQNEKVDIDPSNLVARVEASGKRTSFVGSRTQKRS
jgi:hypothetical protein